MSHGKLILYSRGWQPVGRGPNPACELLIFGRKIKNINFFLSIQQRGKTFLHRQNNLLILKLLDIYIARYTSVQFGLQFEL